MNIIKSRDNLSQIPPTSPAYPIMDDLIRCLIDDYPQYDPEADGFLVSIEEGDTDGPQNKLKVVARCPETYAMRTLIVKYHI